jgi:hypothetical protein
MKVKGSRNEVKGKGSKGKAKRTKESTIDNQREKDKR